ncbi:MAG: hypothetical protein AOA65_0097 [Candidatus Bathyarchaeota archaeon BA1]|nr:MAG: hypothetical protein AOA65_0097 [Candidatus Bathyarchaeota archaeon BA1]
MLRQALAEYIEKRKEKFVEAPHKWEHVPINENRTEPVKLGAVRKITGVYKGETCVYRDAERYCTKWDFRVMRGSLKALSEGEREALEMFIDKETKLTTILDEYGRVKASGARLMKAEPELCYDCVLWKPKG